MMRGLWAVCSFALIFSGCNFTASSGVMNRNVISAAITTAPTPFSSPAPSPAPTIVPASTVVGDYYVSSTLGDDSFPGTLSKPFKTIQKAANVVNPGDTVIVRDGTYTSADTTIVQLNRSGTTSKPIAFKSENRWGAKLDGFNNTTDDGWGVVFDNVHDILLEGFEIKNVGRMATYIMQGSSNITIKGNNIHDIGRRCTDTYYGIVGIYAWLATDITIKNNIFADIGRLQPGEKGCTPTGSYYKNHDHAIYTEKITRMSITSNIIYNSKAGWGIQLSNRDNGPNSNISVLNNTFYGRNVNRAGFVLLYGSASYVLVANNIFYQPSIEGVNVHVSPDITYSNCTIKNNMTSDGVTNLGAEDDNGNIPPGLPDGFTRTGNFDNTDPRMVDPIAYNFVLQSGSPAIGAGVDVGLPFNFLGLPVGKSPNIGAY